MLRETDQTWMESTPGGSSGLWGTGRREDVAVGFQGEDETKDVDDEEDDAGTDGKGVLVGVDLWIVMAEGAEVEDGGDEEGGDGQGEQAAVGFGGVFVEGLPLILQAAKEHGAAADEEEIAEDRAGDGGFDDVVEAAGEGDEAEDDFGGVAEGGVEEAAEGGAGALGEMLGRFAHERGHGNDADAGEEESGDGLPGVVFAEPEMDGEGGGDGQEGEEVEVAHGVMERSGSQLRRKLPRRHGVTEEEHERRIE